MVGEEPIMASLVYASVLNQSSLEEAMNFILADRLASAHAPAALLRQVFDSTVADSVEIGVAARADLAASANATRPANLRWKPCCSSRASTPFRPTVTLTRSCDNTAVPWRNFSRAGLRWSSASTSTRRHALAVAS